MENQYSSQNIDNQYKINVGYTAQNIQTYQQTPQRKSNKLLPIMILLFAGLLAMGGAAYAAYTYYFEAPLKVQAMFTALDKVTSANHSSSIKIVAKAKGLDPSSMVLGDSTDNQLVDDIFGVDSVSAQSMEIIIASSFAGNVERDTTQITKMEGSLEIKANGNYELTNANAGGGFTFGMDIKQPDLEQYFIRITKIPQLGLADTNGFVNKWIKFDVTEFLSLYGTEIDQDELKKITKEISAELETVWIKHRETLFVLKNGGQQKTLNNMTLQNVTYTVENSKLRDFIIDVLRVNLKYAEQVSDLSTIYERIEPTPEEDEKQIVESVDAIMKYISNIKGELWLSAKDNLPYESTMSFDFNGTDDISLSGTVSLSSTINSYNQQFQVESPSDAMTIMEMLQQSYQSDPIYQQSSATSELYVIQYSLENYKFKNDIYPTKLDELINDPEMRLSSSIISKYQINYSAVDGGKDYLLCYVEIQTGKKCINSDGKTIDARQN